SSVAQEFRAQHIIAGSEQARDSEMPVELAFEGSEERLPFGGGRLVEWIARLDAGARAAVLGPHACEFGGQSRIIARRAPRHRPEYAPIKGYMIGARRRDGEVGVEMGG